MLKSRRAKKPVVLITGASQGIGAAIAKAFAAEFHGVSLALVARSEANLAKVCRACTRLGAARAEAFACDVSAELPVATMARSVLERFGHVDVLINNAGQFGGAPFDTMSVAQFDGLIGSNLRSLFLVSKAFVPEMARRGSGDVFNMGSVAGLRVFAGGAGYSAAKFGVTGLSKVLRAEYQERGVRVCCVYPGATVSPSWKGSGIPEERMMPAEDVAQAFIAAYRMSRRTVLEEIVLRPQRGDI